MNNVSCVDCQYSTSYFQFKTTKFLLKDSKIKNIDQQDSYSSLSKSSSYPTIFTVVLVNKEEPEILAPQISIEDTEISNSQGGKASFMTILCVQQLKSPVLNIRSSNFTNVTTIQYGIITISMGSLFNVIIKDSRFTGIRSFTKGGVIYAGPEAKQLNPIQTIGNTEASISEFTITDSIFYDFIDLEAIDPNCPYECMLNYERYGYLFYVDQDPALVFSITNTIIDNFSGKSVDFTEALSLHHNSIYPENDEHYTDQYLSPQGGSIIYLQSNSTISVESMHNFYRGADLTKEGGVYYIYGREKQSYDEGEIEECEFIEVNSTYEGNQAIFGGAIYVIECASNINIQITCSRFRINRALIGGAIFAEHSQINDISGFYQNNFAIEGGVFHVDATNLNFTDTSFTENFCFDGCLVHYKGYNMGINMTRVVATDNWAFKTAALVYVAGGYFENYQEDTYVNIIASYFYRNYASIGEAGLIYSNQIYNRLNIRSSVFEQNFLYNYRNLSQNVRSGHFHLPQVSEVIIDNCLFKPYEDYFMNKLMTEQGECENDICEQSQLSSQLNLLMFSGGVGHSVRITNTIFSTHKVFDNEYVLYQMYEWKFDEQLIAFKGVVQVQQASEFTLESKFMFPQRVQTTLSLTTMICNMESSTLIRWIVFLIMAQRITTMWVIQAVFITS